MPPEILKLQQDINQLKLILAQHQHRGVDSASLRYQDWQQVGKTVLASSATSIRVDIPNKQFLRILIQWGAKSSTSDDYLRFNNVSSGTPYTFILRGGTARTSQNQIDIRDGANSALGGFAIIDVVNNLSSLEKSVVVHTVNRITAVGTAQTFYDIFGTWVNTNAFITRVDLVSSGAATYPANSSIIVLSSKE